MPISQYELLELFVETLMNEGVQDITCAKQQLFGEQVESFFELASAGLIDKPKTWVELYGENSSLIKELSTKWRGEGADGAADMLTVIERFIDENELDSGEAPVKRILDFVYTVV